MSASSTRATLARPAKTQPAAVVAQSVRRRSPGPALCVIGAAVGWGILGPSYRIILDHSTADRLTVVTIRACIAALLLAGWLAWRRPAAFRIRRKDVRDLLCYGVITTTILDVAAIYAFLEASVAVGTILLAMAPALVTIVAALVFHERLTRGKLLALLGSFIGCGLVVGAFRPANLQANAVGIGWGLLAAAGYASYSLMGKRLLTQHPLSTVLVYNQLIGGAGLLLVKLLVSGRNWAPPAELAAIGGWTGVTALVPVVLFAIGLRRLPASEASLLTAAEPVVGVLLAPTLLGEALSLPQATGAALVIVSVVLFAAGTGEKKLA